MTLGYMAALHPQFEARGCRVIGLSVDPVPSHESVVRDLLVHPEDLVLEDSLEGFLGWGCLWHGVLRRVLVDIAEIVASGREIVNSPRLTLPMQSYILYIVGI